MDRKETILPLVGDLKNFLKDAMCHAEAQECLQLKASSGEVRDGFQEFLYPCYFVS